MWYIRGSGQLHRGFLWGNLKEKAQLEDLGVDGNNITVILPSTPSGFMVSGHIE